MRATNRYRTVPVRDPGARRMAKNDRGLHYARLYKLNDGLYNDYELRCNCGYWSPIAEQIENHVLRERRKK